MASIKFTDFGGIRPKATNLRLAIGEALSAQNVDLRRGVIAPAVRQLAFTADTDPAVVADDTVETLFRFHDRETEDDFWIAKTGDVNFAPGPMINDEQRHYYTGDGAPKMFTDESIDNTSPTYGGAPDDTYPYSWYYLGIPAPAAAPTLDLSGVTEPPTVTSGTITKVSTNILCMEHANANTPSLDWETWWEHQIDGPVGTIDRETDIPRQRIGTNAQNQSGWGFTAGTRFKVSEIIDANSFRIVGLSGAAYALRLDVADNDWVFNDYYGAPDRRAYLSLDANRLDIWHWDFILPNGSIVECAGHGLAVDDIVRITGVVEDFFWSSDTTMNLGETSGQYHTMTRADLTDFEFEGELSFITERNGSDIDTTLEPEELPDITSRAYVYTYVSELGEESAPSPATDVITLYEGDTIGLGTFSAPPTDHRRITHIRIYRTATGSAETDFQLVTEIPIATTSYDDELADDALGEVLQTEDWDTPPTEMKGICDMPNGMMVGFYDNVLCFSEPGYPHAWPVDYRYAIGPKIIGIGVVGNSVIVATEGAPVVATGTHSRQISLRNMDDPSPCVDKRSIADAGGTIFYCSTAGLIAANELSFKNTTEDFYTKEQWQQVVGPPSASNRSVRGWYHDNHYILDAVYSIGSVPGETPVVTTYSTGFSTSLLYTNSGGALTANYSASITQNPDTVVVFSCALEDASGLISTGPTAVSFGGRAGVFKYAVLDSGGSKFHIVMGVVSAGEGDLSGTNVVITWPGLVSAGYTSNGRGFALEVSNVPLSQADPFSDAARWSTTNDTISGDVVIGAAIGNFGGVTINSGWTQSGNGIVGDSGSRMVHRASPTNAPFNSYAVSVQAAFSAAPGTEVASSTKLDFDFSDSKGLKITNFTSTIDAAFYDKRDGELYYLVPEDEQPTGAEGLDGERPVLRWAYLHPETNLEDDYVEGFWESGVTLLPDAMAIAAVRVVCRRLRTLDTFTAYGDVTVTVNGYRFDSWAVEPTDEEDVIELLSESVITGVPGAAPWVGEQRSRPFRPSLNTTVDGLSVLINVAGPVQVEMVQLGESMEDLEG